MGYFAGTVLMNLKLPPQINLNLLEFLEIETFFSPPTLPQQSIIHYNFYFSYTFLNSISIEIYKLSFVNFLSFFKEDKNIIYSSIIT